MSEYTYKAKIEEAVNIFHDRFWLPDGGPREYLLQNRCRADFCFLIRPKGILFIEDDDGARAVNNLIKYWIWAEHHPNERPIHLIHIIEKSRPAQIDNLMFLANKMSNALETFVFHHITIENWQEPIESWLQEFRKIVATI